MTYDETLAYIHSVSWKGSRPGLSRITELMERLGNIQDSLRFVHVAGTNGKGSFCCMLESVLRAAHIKTGMFTSPFLWDFCERFMIDGRPVSRALLCRATAHVREQADRMEDKPTEFELITAIGFVCFAMSGCEVVILEAGMGGRLDSTNVISRALLSVITGIALEHTEYLGDTVEKIAYEKAGIIKKECPVLFGGGEASVSQVIRARAAECNSPYYELSAEPTHVTLTPEGARFDFSEYRGIAVSLCGAYQPHNAALVLTAVAVLRSRGLHVDEDAVRRGLENVYWPGRFEKLYCDPPMYYDGGHNPQGIAACAQSIRDCLGEKKVVLLSGVMRDKDYRQMISCIAPMTACAVTLTPDNGRALPAARYAQAFEDAGIAAYGFDDARRAVCRALELAEKMHIPVVAMGSLYMYAQIRSAVCEIAKAQGKPLPHPPLGEQ